MYNQLILGKTKLAPRKQYVIKEDDFKVAYVTLVSVNIVGFYQSGCFTLKN